MQMSFDIPPQQQKCPIQQHSYSNCGGFPCAAKAQNQNRWPTVTERPDAVAHFQQAIVESSPAPPMDNIGSAQSPSGGAITEIMEHSLGLLLRR
jgi:hypothetical protein